MLIDIVGENAAVLELHRRYGSVALYRIAPDGYSTELIEIMDYEYQDENKVTYTPEIGNISPQEFERGDYLRGFDVPLYFKLFAGKRDQK